MSSQHADGEMSDHVSFPSRLPSDVNTETNRDCVSSDSGTVSILLLDVLIQVNGCAENEILLTDASQRPHYTPVSESEVTVPSAKRFEKNTEAQMDSCSHLQSLWFLSRGEGAVEQLYITLQRHVTCTLRNKPLWI